MSGAAGSNAVEIGLNAAIIAMNAMAPHVLTVAGSNGDDHRAALPLGPFDPVRHRTFEAGLRASVTEQTGLSLGYVEQLYTFGDRGRHRMTMDTAPHIVSVGYLALTRIDPDEADTAARGWTDWYGFLPWEDWRSGRPGLLAAAILPELARWTDDGDQGRSGSAASSRRSRLRLAFGLDDFPWDEERVLDRYELLYEAGLVEEAVADGRAPPRPGPTLGRAMRYDHRRILATAVSRLRGKLKYRPVIFELMPPRFTLTELQSTVEAISGRHVHKQNFRRLVDGAELVEPTGETSGRTGGRPAALYRFRRKIFEERPAPGLKLGGRS
jgi:hypothetical protein